MKTDLPSLRILIVDDEPPARKRARNLLGKIEQVEIVGEVTNGNQALEMIESLQPDVVLLDIQMPDLDGIRVLEALDDPPAIIFSTAFDHYAVQAFDLEVVDYLLKPYSTERLSRALDRVRRFLSGNEKDMLVRPDTNKIPAQSGLTTVMVPPEKIVILEIVEGVVFLKTTGGESLICNPSLSELEDLLPAHSFFRVSRQAIINLDTVESYSPTPDGGLNLKLQGNYTTRVSRRRARYLRVRLTNHQ